ncbi:phage tail tip fiber protein, partial [Acinetobacter sp. NS4_7]
RATKDEALTKQIASLQSKVDDEISAAIRNEATARANLEEAIAENIETVQTTLDGHTASIQEHKSSIDGLQAEWKIKVQAGGKISGVSLGVSGTESQFLVLADRFAVGMSTNGVLTYPFIIDQGKVVMNTAVIKDGSIESAKIGSLSADKITAGNIAADRMKANIVQAIEGKFTSLSSITGTIGVLRTATSGARTEIKDNLIEVYDSAGKVRVRLGVW